MDVSWCMQGEKARPTLLQADDSALEAGEPSRRRDRRRRERLSLEQAPVDAIALQPKCVACLLFNVRAFAPQSLCLGGLAVRWGYQ